MFDVEVVLIGLKVVVIDANRRLMVGCCMLTRDRFDMKAALAARLER